MRQKTQPQQPHTDYPSECTTIIVGRQHTSDGSMIVARSEDWNAVLAKNLEIYEDTDHGPERFVALDSPFRCDLPKRALGYSALAPYHLHGHWGSGWLQQRRRRYERYRKYLQ